MFVEVDSEVLLKMGMEEDQIKEGMKFKEAKGCSRCQKGYAGRAAIFEFLSITLF